MNANKPDWYMENERLQSVVGKIADRLAQKEQELGHARTGVIEAKKNFWNDVTVNMTDDIEKSETFNSISQQAKLVLDQERTQRQAQLTFEILTKLRNSPYFGRIDFLESGEKQAERVYVGLSSFVDDDGETFLIYDWRAPISSLFYDHSPGAAEYDTPGGKIAGTMELKRQFIIERGKLKHLFDTDLTIGDALLQTALAQQAGDRMKNIVATIQKKQNQVIRNDTAKLLIVQGAAGSGKTSAALQRIAFLLYKHRNTLTAEQILLFSPNPVFGSYISTVLPELGEANMRQSTFQQFLERRLGAMYEVEDLFDQTEYVLGPADHSDYDTRIAAIRYKASRHFFKTINNYAALLEHKGMKFRDIRFRGQTLISKAELSARFYDCGENIRLDARTQMLREYVLRRLDELGKLERKKKWVEEEIELLDAQEYQNVYSRLRQSGKFTGNSFDDSKLERALLARYVVRRAFAPLRKKAERLRFIDIAGLYRALFADSACFAQCSADGRFPPHWEQIRTVSLKHLAGKRLNYEDATPLLFLQEMAAGFQTETGIRHVFVDEAQDYSPFQFAFMQHVFPGAKMTVLGDLNQAIFLQTADSDSFAGLVDLFGNDSSETIRLETSYRSTREIVEYTATMLPAGGNIAPFERSGEAPKLIDAGNEAERMAKIAADVRALLAQGQRTIGILCKTAAESKETYERLNGLIPVELIAKGSSALHEGASVMPAYLAKGIEFDAVIIADGSRTAYSRESERKLFYTACTRAMHILHIYYTGEPTSFAHAPVSCKVN